MLLRGREYDPQSALDEQLLAYVLIPVVQHESDIFVWYWNSHGIRVQDKLEIPAKVPDYIFSFPGNYGGTDMRQRESKQFAEIPNRLREGNHTTDDIAKLKERCISENCRDYPTDIPHFFIQNSKVDEWNNRVHMAATGDKYTIRALDSVIGANSPELRSKILNQIPLDPRKTKQLASNLQLAEGERTERALNARADDGITNGANNIIKKITLYDKSKPSGIIWVQFDHVDVGEKTRHDNKQLYL